jgi:DNA polymerase IV
MWILLADMDAFFASVEQLDHPRLRGRPVIVCGDPGRRGVVTAASYEARPSGVRAGMSLARARRLCPGADYVEGHPERYVALSMQLLDLYLSFTPEVEPFSVDEAFLGLDHRIATADAAGEEARRVQQAVAHRFGLAVSVGAGPNKLVAKMAAGLGKPRGLTALDEEAFRRAFWPLGVQELWGVGPKLAVRMRSLGIMTVGDLARAPIPSLKAAFGIVGPALREAAWGRDETPLVPCHLGVDPKSMGHEVTLSADSSDAALLEGTLLRLADQVARRLRGEGFVGRTVTVKLRDADFTTITRQQVLGGHTDDHRTLFDAARGLWRANWRGGPLRLLGLSVSHLERRPAEPQTELFASEHREGRLTETLDRLRDRLGEAAVVPAGSLTHRRPLGHVPFGGPARCPGTPQAGGERRDGER